MSLDNHQLITISVQEYNQLKSDLGDACATADYWKLNSDWWRNQCSNQVVAGRVLTFMLFVSLVIILVVSKL